MYLPEHFEEGRVEELHRIINEYPFGTLVTQSPNGLDANHLPFILEKKHSAAGTLLAHVARANPIWRPCTDGDTVLVIFQAADAYISPNWYPSKPETRRHVPTWNYLVVHVHGRITIRDDNTFVRGVVGRLTAVHEAHANPETPWKMTDSSKEYIDQMVQAIVGIEIEITKMVGKFKLSQNREDRDRIGAAENLRKHGEQIVSSAMLNAKQQGK